MAYVDEFGRVPPLMPLDEEGKAPVIQGTCSLDSFNSVEGRNTTLAPRMSSNVTSCVRRLDGDNEPEIAVLPTEELFNWLIRHECHEQESYILASRIRCARREYPISWMLSPGPARRNSNTTHYRANVSCWDGYPD